MKSLPDNVDILGDYAHENGTTYGKLIASTTEAWRRSYCDEVRAAAGAKMKKQYEALRARREAAAKKQTKPQKPRNPFADPACYS